MYHLLTKPILPSITRAMTYFSQQTPMEVRPTAYLTTVRQQPMLHCLVLGVVVHLTGEGLMTHTMTQDIALVVVRPVEDLEVEVRHPVCPVIPL